MANLRGRTIRTGFGAVALGFKNNSMKSIAAAGAVLALATTGTVVVQTQVAPAAVAQTSGTVAATPVTDPTKLIEADGIANGYVENRTGMTNAFATLSGLVGLKETSASSSLAGTMGVNDVTVYMKFKDVDGTISPIYSTKSHQLGNTAGNYVFDLRAKDEEGNVLSHPDSPVPGGEYSFVDAYGKPHIFRAQRGQEYRLWVDSPLKNEETGNDLGYVRQAGGGVPGAWAPVTQGTANGAFYLEGTNMQRTGVFLEERAPSVDENSYMVSPEFSMDEEGWHKPGLGADVPRYSYFGRVWSDAEGGPDRNETGPLYEWEGDQPIEGAKVYASVLSDAGIAEYERLKIADKPYREQAAATKAMIENMRANGKEPILKTVGAVTDAEGRYTIRMGEDIGERIKNYTYIWAENNGKVLNSFSGFPTPVFQKVNANSGENPNWGGDVGIPSHAKHRWYNINFAEVQADIANLDIVNYDSYLNPADLPEGINNLEPAKVKLTGALPFSGDSKIRWIGPDGKQIGDDCAVDTLADAANCSLAPEDFNKPGTYVAQLVNAYDVVVGQDSFIAVDKVRQNGELEPQYKDATAPTGEKTTVDAPKDKDGKEIPEGTTFEPGGQVTDPDGNKIDKPEWITVNPDGSIVVEPPKDAKTGDYKIPVLVTYPDGSRETIVAKVKVTDAKDKDAATFEPGYEDGSGKPGEDVTVPAPEFKDKDGKDTTAPEGTKFTPGDNAPEGVKVDPNTGAVTVPVPADAKPGDKITVPVVVTYPDGTKDTVDVTVTVTEKDNGVYAPAYEDKLVVPGKETKSSPTFKDNDGKDTKAPEGSKFKIADGFTAPEGYTVTIDENSGEITVTADESKLNKDTKEEFDVPVTVTYPDKSTDEVKANFKLDTDGDGKPDTTDEDDDNDSIPDEVEKDKGSNPKNKGSIPATPIEPGKPTNAATFEPGYEDGSGKPGSDVKIDAPKFKDKDGKDTKAPEGTKFTPGDNAPEGVTIDENTGEITVKVPEGAKPGDKITVPVVVTYPDGTKDTVDVTVTVEQPDAPAEKPDWSDDKGKPGDKVEIPNDGGDVPAGTTTEVE
ncbi:YPDG domain-containing protein, partial [Corynebacterium macclintockiae]|uniref:YPDG domain-containing protein n=1 Tax=Corynebacterium macclintockiae TaxID=2913501 RepID=UPI003EB6C506